MYGKWGAVALAVALFGGGQAQAGLIGNFVNSLNYDFPTLGGNPLAQVELTSLTSIYPFSIGASGLYFLTGGPNAPIHIGDTQIVIGSNQTGLFCSTTPCTDTFNGFVFVFSSGANISNVSIDGATPSNSPWRNAIITHTPGSQEVDVNLRNVNPPALPVLINSLTGAASNRTELLNELSSTLVLDLAFAGTTPVPEPATLSLLGAGLLGLAIARRRRRG